MFLDYTVTYVPGLYQLLPNDRCNRRARVLRKSEGCAPIDIHACGASRSMRLLNRPLAAEFRR